MKELSQSSLKTMVNTKRDLIKIEFMSKIDHQRPDLGKINIIKKEIQIGEIRTR